MSVCADNDVGRAFWGTQQLLGQISNKKRRIIDRNRRIFCLRQLPSDSSIFRQLPMWVDAGNFVCIDGLSVCPNKEEGGVRRILHAHASCPIGVSIFDVSGSRARFSPFFGRIDDTGGHDCPYFSSRRSRHSAGLAIVGSRNLGQAQGRVMAIARVLPLIRIRGFLVTLLPTVGAGMFPHDSFRWAV